MVLFYNLVEIVENMKKSSSRLSAICFGEVWNVGCHCRTTIYFINQWALTDILSMDRADQHQYQQETCKVLWVPKKILFTTNLRVRTMEGPLITFSHIFSRESLTVSVNRWKLKLVDLCKQLLDKFGNAHPSLNNLFTCCVKNSTAISTRKIIISNNWNHHIWRKQTDWLSWWLLVQKLTPLQELVVLRI